MQVGLEGDRMKTINVKLEDFNQHISELMIAITGTGKNTRHVEEADMTKLDMRDSKTMKVLSFYNI